MPPGQEVRNQLLKHSRLAQTACACTPPTLMEGVGTTASFCTQTPTPKPLARPPSRGRQRQDHAEPNDLVSVPGSGLAEDNRLPPKGSPLYL